MGPGILLLPRRHRNERETMPAQLFVDPPFKAGIPPVNMAICKNHDFRDNKTLQNILTAQSEGSFFFSDISMY